MLGPFFLFRSRANACGGDMTLSVEDAAKLLSVSTRMIHRWIKQRDIPYHLVNEHVHFNQSELLEWATLHRIRVSPEIFRDVERETAALPSLEAALRAGGVVPGVAGGDKSAVLRAIVDVLILPPAVDREFLYQVLAAREALGSTGVGDGIAIPHVRHPVVLEIPQPAITLCFLDHPIDFNAVDGLPVDTLFTLISPTVRTHLHLLSRLAFVLQNADFKASLKRRPPREELIAALARVESSMPGLIRVP